MRILITVIATVLLSQSCILINSHTPADRLNVVYSDDDAKALEPFVEKFLLEAQKRDVIFRNRKVRISTKPMASVNGTGNSATRQVKISTSSQQWKNWEKYNRDYNDGKMQRTIAHELSHACLGYGHRFKDDEKIQIPSESGNSITYSKSIMTSVAWGAPNLEGHSHSHYWDSWYWDELFRVGKFIRSSKNVIVGEPTDGCGIAQYSNQIQI